MPDRPPPEDPQGDPRRTHRWRSPWVIGGTVAALIVLAAGIASTSGSDRSPPSETDTSPPRFVDDTDLAGVEHVYDGEFAFFVGGGVAAFDCDDDGHHDLYFAGGSRPAALFRNESEVGGALRLVPHPSPVTDLTEVTGAYPLDIDNDATTDLVVLRRGGNEVLRGLGDCRFEPAALGIDPGEAWTTAFSATWEGSNTLPTLAFGNYLVPNDDPNEIICDDHQFVRPRATGDGYQPVETLAPGHCTLSMLFSDWSRSGRRDLRLANDRHYYTDGQEQMFRITPGEPPRELTLDDGWQPLQLWGMGIASRDVTGDGYPEVFLTSQGDNKLQTLDEAAGVGEPTYRDIALRSGATAQRPFVGGDVLPSTAWHPEFADVNNDGLADLFITKGNVEAQPDHAADDPNNLLIGQADGTFVEGAVEAGIVGFESSRGAALVDLNLDGMLDLVVVNRRENVSLWRNVGDGNGDEPAPLGNWIAVRITQPAANTDAIGAWVEIRVDERTAVREVTVGGGHVGGQLGWIHTGLGGAEQAEVRVRWPDGEIGPWMTVDANRFVTIERGATTVTAWQPD